MCIYDDLEKSNSRRRQRHAVPNVHKNAKMLDLFRLVVTRVIFSKGKCELLRHYAKQKAIQKQNDTDRYSRRGRTKAKAITSTPVHQYHRKKGVPPYKIKILVKVGSVAARRGGT